MAEGDQLIAVIDVGSNATRLRIFKLEAGNNLKETARHRFAVRLGAGAFETGRLQGEAMAEGVEAVSSAAKIAREAGARIFAVATSAVRESANGADFVGRVKDAAGIDLRVISGDEEAELAALGATGVIAGHDRAAYVIDIGGGSTEILRTDAGGSVEWRRSLPLGAVRMAERWGTGQFSLEELARFSREIRKILVGSLPITDGEETGFSYKQAFALGGTPGALIELARGMGKEAGAGAAAREISARDLDSALTLMAGATPATLSAKYGVDPMRATLLLPGAMILRETMQELHITGVQATDRGVCEGVALRYAAGL